MRVLVISLLLLFTAVTAYAEQEMYQFSKTIDTERFASLTKEIRCVVCQNQNIADSNAPLANDLRAKVYLMVKDQKSDEEIKDYLVKRYGEFILLRPRFNLTTGILWVFPLLGIAFIFLFLYCYRFIKANPG